MFRRSNILLLVALAFLCFAFSPIKKYIRRAELNIERGNLEQARNYYLKALAIDSNSIKANYGMGMMLCELLDDYEGALPYLEKANMPPVEDSLHDVLFALGKCYQHAGEFQKAIYAFDKIQYVVNLQEEKDYAREIEKRKADCHYALDHRNDPPDPNLFVVNGGRSINSDKPEYVPVLLPGNKVIFTSKRKDSEHEQINYLDGKYFESMYIADVNPNGFTNIQRYTIPDQAKKKLKANRHESVISLSQDGKKLFTFYEGAIYEINLDEKATKPPRKLETSAQEESLYENHAYLSRDGRHLYFSAESENGMGGTDIFYTYRNDSGQWRKPVNLGAPVNTAFDEDAPFLSYDGHWLYFASTGHKGYGNFDLYRSEIIDGKYGEPQNLGHPLNSPAHDLFLVNDSLMKTGYFASGRKGGQGDMDIYKVIYLDKIDSACNSEAAGLITLSPSDIDSTDLKNVMNVNLPAGFHGLKYEWWVNGERQEERGPALLKTYPGEDSYTITAKVIALCDTCLNPVVSCMDGVNTIKRYEKAAPGENLAGGGNNGGGVNNGGGGNNGAPIGITSGVFGKGDLKGKQPRNKGDKGKYDVMVDGEVVEWNPPEGPMGDEASFELLQSIRFDSRPVLFGFNKSGLESRAFQERLDSNIAALKRNDSLRIQVIGYTDSRGSAIYNQLLSEHRAKAVVSYLIKHGLDKYKIVAINGRGEEELLNDCDGTKSCTDEEHRQNRRVVIKVFRIKK